MNSSFCLMLKNRSFLVSARKERKEADTRGTLHQPSPLYIPLLTQAWPDGLYTKGENVPIFAHPSSDSFHFKQKRRDTFCLNGRYTKVRCSSPVRAGWGTQGRVVLRAANQNNT